MDLGEIKRITAYARRNGIKRLKMDNLEIEFHDAVIFPQKKRQRLMAVTNDPPRNAPPAEPTLEQINNYIYGPVDEAI